MMGLTQTSIYAVQALSRMPSGEGETCLIRDLAATTNIPKPYLAKIVNKLNHSGLVRAKRGYRGGIALNRPPKQVSLLEVIEAVEGRDWITDCLLGANGSSRPNSSPAHKAWAKITAQIRHLLGTTMLAQVMVLSKLRPTGNVSLKPLAA